MPGRGRPQFDRAEVITYSPDAVWAVSTAIDRNPILYLISCHWVVHSDGRIGQYHWGSEQKRVLMAWETGFVDSLRG